jgi:hypothetical protein
MEDLKYCKLIETLRTFSPREFYDFEKIAASGFFNNNRNYTPYIKSLKKYYPQFKGDNFCRINARKFIFMITYPDKRYNDQYMKNIFTDLIHLAEETLFQKIIREHNHQNLASLAIEESKRNLYHLANHNINILNKKLEENGIDETYFYCKGMSEIAHTVLFNKKHGRNHETGKPFTTGVNFIYFSLITLALSIYNSSVRRTMLNIEEEKEFNEYYAGLIDLEKLEKIILETKDANKELILIFLYYLIHKTKKAGFASYEKMRDHLLRNYPKFSSRMLFYVTSILLFTLYEDKDKIKEEKFRSEYHKLALFSITNNCYKIMKTGTFQFNKFRSYYLNALALGEIEWLRKFADNYINELPPEVQEETLCLINSNIKFEDKLFNEAYEEIKKIKCTNLFSKFDSRLLKLKIYFQKQLYLQAEDSLEAFKKFISKNKVAKNIFRGNFTLFIKFYKKLLDITEGKESDSGIVLIDLRKTPAFPERSWLIESFENIITQKTLSEKTQ